MTIRVERHGDVVVIVINRPAVRNAIDRPTAAALVAAFDAFEADPELRVAVLTGAGGVFCAGADLTTLADPDPERTPRAGVDGDGPLGPTRRLLGKPVIAAVEGHAVAGGLELALWCDLRVAADDAVFGVFCRRWGVPLMDGGTVRLPRLIGHSRALDMILTGREVRGDEAFAWGLANRLVPRGEALTTALELAHQLAGLPPVCMRSDRRSSYEAWGMPLDAALRNEARAGLEVIASGETQKGAGRFRDGAGRHGAGTG
ncbi:MAG TPA: crotonase/enoyl-CoA hydratase family protein [Solirubrobacteraceae bacterium]